MIDELPQAGWRERYAAWRLIVGVAWRASPWRAAFALVCTIFMFTWPPVWAIAMGRVADGIVQGDRAVALSGIWFIVGWSALAGAVGSFSFHVRMVLRELATHQLDLEIVELTSGIAGIDHMERPAFADRIEALLAQRIQLAGSFDALVLNVASSVSIAASLGVLATVDPLLLLLPLAGLPSVWTSTRSTKRVERTRDATAPHARLVRRLVDTSVSPIAGKELRVFGVEPHLRHLHARESRIAEAQWVTTSLRNTAEGILTQSLFAGGFVGSIALLVLATADGRASIGDVVAAITLAATVQGQVRQLVRMASWMRSCAESARRYAWLVGHAADAAAIEAPSDPLPAPERLQQGITLEGVSFRYPGTEVDVLRNVDLNIPAGSIVAIVGDNGAGKSTLVKLLARYYEPTSGTIRVDGTALNRIPASAWRTKLSAGFQDHARLELLASEAVGLGHLPDLHDVDAHTAALDRAAAADVLAGLPDGLSTQLGKSFADGHELSGGQWQKVALGRAMMRAEPLLLLLDEPTAALDAEAEHELFSRYSAAARRVRERTGAITLLVSHRFSTVRAADLIVVIDRHGIAECGGHDELMALGGSYAELFEIQASSYR